MSTVLAVGSSSWILVHEVVHRSRASRKSHLNSYTSPGHLRLSLAHAQVRRVYCVDGNGCKGGVYYVVDVLKCSWDTVLRSWCICFTWVLGTSMPVLMSEWQVLYLLSRRSTSLPVFVTIGLDYYFPWFSKFYLIHIHCNILDKYKRMWASRRKTPQSYFMYAFRSTYCTSAFLCAVVPHWDPAWQTAF